MIQMKINWLSNTKTVIEQIDISSEWREFAARKNESMKT